MKLLSALALIGSAAAFAPAQTSSVSQLVLLERWTPRKTKLRRVSLLGETLFLTLFSNLSPTIIGKLFGLERAY